MIAVGLLTIIAANNPVSALEYRPPRPVIYPQFNVGEAMDRAFQEYQEAKVSDAQARLLDMEAAIQNENLKEIRLNAAQRYAFYFPNTRPEDLVSIVFGGLAKTDLRAIEMPFDIGEPRAVSLERLHLMISGKEERMSSRESIGLVFREIFRSEPSEELFRYFEPKVATGLIDSWHLIAIMGAAANEK